MIQRLLSSLFVLLLSYTLWPTAAVAQAGCAPSLSTGLKLWLPLDESGGAAAMDASGRGFKGETSSINAVWQPAGGANKGALSITGSGYLRMPLYWQPTTFSISWWVKPNQISNYSQAIYAKMPAGDTWGGFMFHGTSNGLVYVGTDYSTLLVLPNGTLTTGDWQHFVFTYSADGKGRLYRNGTLWAPPKAMTAPAGWEGLVVGASQYGWLPFNGSLDELRVYERALSDEQVQQLTQCRPVPPPLSLCPPLQVLGSADATIRAGETTTLQASASLAGSMLTFDGVDDHLQIATRDGDPRLVAKAYGITNNFTMEAWLLPTATHKIDQEMAQYGGLSGGQRWAFSSIHGGLYFGEDHVVVALSVGTNGVSVYESGSYYLPAVLVWQAPAGQPLTSWTHVAVVYTNRQPSLYINGVLVKQTTVEVRERDGNRAIMSRPWVHPSANLGGNTYLGSLDEVRVWSTPRSAADILRTKNNVFTNLPSALIGYWRLDEGEGQTARDLTSSYNDGHLKGGGGLPGPNGTGPTWAPSTAPLTGVNDEAPLALTWTPTAGLSASTGTSLSASPAVTTAYLAQASTSCGATAQARMTVTVTPAATPALVNPPVACTPTLAPLAPPPSGTSPSSLNYVRTYTARQAYTNPADLVNAPVAGVQITTQYLDGLGRPVQTVRHRESPLGRDLVQPIEYDALGRQARDYLPYVSSTNTGAYQANAVREQYDFYRTTTQAGPGLSYDNVVRTGTPYSEKTFEPSPLNRVTAQTSPGESWASHPVTFSERPNTDADAVPLINANYDLTNTLARQSAYAAGELWLNETTDEDGRRVRAFTDKQGQLVAKRIELPAAPGQWLTTLYVYDYFNRLRAVIPPRATVLLLANNWNLAAPDVTRLLFLYRYDGKGRLLAKRVPDQDGEQQLVYNQLDQPILIQDAQQRTRSEWSYTKYDALGRVLMTGLVTRAAPAATLQAEADATTGQWEQRALDGGNHYYTLSQSYPNLTGAGFSQAQALVVNYYDDYNFDNDAQGLADASFSAAYNSQFASPPVADNRVTGMLTRTKTRVLGVAAGAVGEWLVATTFYDEKARPIQVVSTNARGGEDVTTSQLDFTGQVVKRYAVHNGPNHAALAVAETPTYDPAGRVLEVRQQVDAEPTATLLATHTYNELGQLVRKTLSPNTSLQQQVDYTYNARGWLAGLNEDMVSGATPLSVTTDLWGFRLSYDCGFAVPQYNGNISGQQWRAKGDGVARAYGYLYDGANRLTRGDYVAQTSAGSWNNERQNYNMGARYDENGNILGLVRHGLLADASAKNKTPRRFGKVDQLAYSYAGNRLTAVDDSIATNRLPQPAGTAGALSSLAGDFLEKNDARTTGLADYAYDANGSLTLDRNKGISQISYNHLNLPERVEFTPQDYILFRYAATGQKVAKLVYQAGKAPVQTDYLNGFQYEADSLRFFAHAEGRVLRFVSPVSGQARYEREYTLKDHLGNLRLAYRKGTRAAYVATMEVNPASRATLEEQQWDERTLADTRANAGAQARTGAYVASLNAALGKPIGPLKMLAVRKGDTLLVTAPGYYPQPIASNSSYTFSLLGFVAQLLQQPAPAPTAEAGKKLKPFPFLGLGLALLPSLQQNNRVPKGYVRLLVFNQDSILLSSQTRQLSETASSGYEELTVSAIAPEDGYVQVYVGNESDVNVYFDDVQLDYRPALLVQENEYDPWGLNLAGLSKTPTTENKYSWNGKERQDDFGLNWLDHGWRFYDPALGRWVVTDPDGEEGDQEGWTSYQFGMDNAVRYNDLDGRQAGSGDDWYTADRQKNGLTGSAASQPNLLTQLATPFNNFVSDVLSLTDLNDAAVLVTIATRGSGNAINIDGTKAGNLGIGLAAIGAALPFVSGSGANKIVRKLVSLDNNALIAAIEGGQSAAVKKAIEGSKVTVSRQAAREFLQTGKKSELKTYMKQTRATISKTGGSAAEVAGLEQKVSTYSTKQPRKIGHGDARIATDAQKSGATIITRDTQFTKRLGELGIPSQGF